MQSEGIKILQASPEYAAAVRAAMGECTGEHRYFVANTAAVQDEGTVFVFLVCTACGAAKRHEFVVSEKRNHITLEK